MSKSAPRAQLYTPRTSRVIRPRVDPEAVGQATESIARFFGTGTYLLIQTIVVVAWIIVNIVAVSLRFDPYPFILLNLAFSTQAAYAAPLILLAQNRQDERDRANIDRDRQVAARTQADTEYLARELASVRISLDDVVTRQDLEEHLERLAKLITDGRPDGNADRSTDSSPDGRVGDSADLRADGRADPRADGQRDTAS